MEPLDEAGRARVNEALSHWQQGDCVLGEHWFLFRSDVAGPLTSAGAQAAAEGADIVEVETRGFMVVSQTCDIVRDCERRAFVQVSPLVEVEPAVIREVESGRRPMYAVVPALVDEGLVADLDQVMTVAKSVAAGWKRVPGCETDGEVRRLRRGLVRQRGRVAFPDTFVEFMQPLSKRLSSKHDKNSPEGRALRALREIRVRAAPSWAAEEVELLLWFVRNVEDEDFEGQDWTEFLDQWLARIPKNGRFVEVEGSVLALEDLTALEYVESDPLDLDHLSARRKA